MIYAKPRPGLISDPFREAREGPDRAGTGYGARRKAQGFAPEPRLAQTRPVAPAPGFLPDPGSAPALFSPPLVELRRVALPSQSDGCDPRLAPRLSLRLEHGERLALRARDPALARDVLRLIARQSAAIAGTVCLDGRDIWLLPAAEARQAVALVDMAWQGDAGASLRQNVMRALLPEGRDWGGARDDQSRNAVTAALTKTGLIARAAEPFGTLDAAERLAIRIARALTQEPRILLLDLTGADPQTLATPAPLPGTEGLSVVIATSPEEEAPWATRQIWLEQETA